MNYLPYSTDHSNDCNQNSNSLNNTDDLNSYSGVVNLSSYHLSDSELSLLSKGLTFACTPGPPDTGVIFEDLEKFHRSIKRKLAIEKLTAGPTNFQQAAAKIGAPFYHQKFKNPSNWNPPGPPILEYMFHE